MNVRRESPKNRISTCLGLVTLCVAGFDPAHAAATDPVHPAKQGSRDTCFARESIEGFSTPDDHTVLIEVFPRKIIRLDLMGDCVGLTFRQSLGLEDRPSSPWICSPLDATVVFRDHGIRERCPVVAIHRLTAEEINATPKRDRP